MIVASCPCSRIHSLERWRIPALLGSTGSACVSGILDTRIGSGGIRHLNRFGRDGSHPRRRPGITPEETWAAHSRHSHPFEHLLYNEGAQGDYQRTPNHHAARVPGGA